MSWLSTPHRRTQYTCTILVEKLDKRLLSLPVGIIFLNVCSLTLAPSSGPDIRVFKCFQSSWADTVHAAFHAGLEDIEVTRKITLGKGPEVLNFVRTMTSRNSATRRLPGTAHSDHH